MLVENGEVKKVNIEPDGKGLTCSLAPEILKQIWNFHFSAIWFVDTDSFGTHYIGSCDIVKLQRTITRRNSFNHIKVKMKMNSSRQLNVFILSNWHEKQEIFKLKPAFSTWTFCHYVIFFTPRSFLGWLLS